MKKIAALGLSMALVLGLFGCGGAGNDEESVPVASQPTVTTEQQTQETPEATEKDYDGVTLRIAWWGGDARNNQTIDIIENFEKQYKNLNIEVEYGGFGDYFTKLTTQATAGTLPDVYMMNAPRLMEFAEGGVMENLDGFVADGTIDLSKANETVLSGGLADGKLVAVSTGSNAPAMFYDPTALEAAGATLDVDPTWSELVETIDKVYAATGKKAMFTFWNSTNHTFSIYLRSMGKEIFNETNDAFGFTVDELATYLEFVYDLYQKESVLRGDMFEGDYYTQLQDANNCWLMLSGEFSNALGSHIEGSGKELELCCYPNADNATTSGSYLTPTMLWAIASNSENKELAAEFINYFVNDTYVYDVCGVDRGVPVSSDVVEYMATTAKPADVKGIAFVNEIMDAGLVDVPQKVEPANAAEAHRYISELFEKLGFDQLKRDDIREAAQKAYDNGNAILKGNAAK